MFCSDLELVAKVTDIVGRTAMHGLTGGAGNETTNNHGDGEEQPVAHLLFLWAA